MAKSGKISKKTIDKNSKNQYNSLVNEGVSNSEIKQQTKQIMAKYTRHEIEEMLSGGIYKVTFTKVTDASLCTAICTRDFGWLSQPEIAEELGYEEPHGGYCHNKNIIVWCIERQREGEKMETINGWRSFDPACVEKIEFFSPTQDEDIEVEEV